MSWKYGGLVDWVEDDTAYISVAFSWKLPEAYQRAVWLRSQGYKVRVGGSGLFANKSYMNGVADIGGEVNALVRHNPRATIASRGCSVGCWFCIVPTMEGKTFTLLPDFEPRPILCDNNLSGLPVEYQEYIIDKYIKCGVVLEDANSGFEPRSFDEDTYTRWKKINHGAWRFAYDETDEKEYVSNVVNILRDEPPSFKRVYVLIGNEPFDMCMDRIMKVIDWGCEPHVQPVMALNTLIKKPMVRYDWTDQKLKDVARWANRWLWRRIPFNEYNKHRHSRQKEVRSNLYF